MGRPAKVPGETLEERKLRLAQYAREYRRVNAARIKEQHHERYMRNPQKYRDQNRARRLLHLDEALAKARRYREQNHAHILELDRQRRAHRGPAFKRAQHLRFNYGLSLDAYNAMRVAQEDRCATCRTPFRPGRYGLHVDHDHVTGQVRALLCGHCNGALGWAREDPFLLRTLAAYLNYHADRQMPQREIAAA